MAKRLLGGPLVVKLGGSLMEKVPEIVRILRGAHRSLLIVPGGGPFADAVRRLTLDPDAAHWMAVLAMEQYGWYIAAQGLATSEEIAIPEKPTVLLPYRALRAADPLPHTWDVTSDTIAAWAAAALELDLVLLKSVEGISVNGVIQDVISTPLSCSEVDPMFIPFVLDTNRSACIVNGRRMERVTALVEGKRLRGTVIKAYH